jgi:hypothetical protein
MWCIPINLTIKIWQNNRRARDTKNLLLYSNTRHYFPQYPWICIYNILPTCYYNKIISWRYLGYYYWLDAHFSHSRPSAPGRSRGHTKSHQHHFLWTTCTLYLQPFPRRRKPQSLPSWSKVQVVHVNNRKVCQPAPFINGFKNIEIKLINIS